jgi:hypothetical protein
MIGKAKSILWLSDYYFKPILAQRLELSRIFDSEITIQQYDLSLTDDDVKKLLSDGEYSGVVVVSNRFEKLAPFTKDDITIPVYCPDLIPATRPEDEDMIVEMPCGVAKIHFKQFNRLVGVGCGEIIFK